jgi:AcrR family transcriptional regulator
METSTRPLRKDAERNRQRILDAARELFAERGLGVTLNDIAHHAGVGVGTVYRRFPDKHELIEALFEQRLEELVSLMQAAVNHPDPWQGLVGALEQGLELQATDRGFKELVLGSPDGRTRTTQMRARLLPLARALVARAHASGQLRADVEAPDIPMMQLMLGTVVDVAGDDHPELWRRYLQIFLQGLRATPAPPAPLAVGPLAPAEVDAAMSKWRPPRR